MTLGEPHPSLSEFPIGGGAVGCRFLLRNCLREEPRSGILVPSLSLAHCVTPHKSPATSQQSPVPTPWFSPFSHIQLRQQLELRGCVISISGPHLLPFPPTSSPSL